MLRTFKKNDKFAFKGDKSRMVRITFWLMKVVPTWKKFEKHCTIWCTSSALNSRIARPETIADQQTCYGNTLKCVQKL